MIAVDTLLHLLKRKVYALMKGYLMELRPVTIQRNRDEYHADYLASRIIFDMIEDEEEQPVSLNDDNLDESKLIPNVPNRQQIKVLSAKYIEETVAKLNE